MHSRVFIYATATVAFAIHASAFAYELATHARITDRAVLASRLNAPDGLLEGRLGIDVWTRLTTESPFRSSVGDLYFEFSGTAVSPRFAKGYESAVMKTIGLQTQTTSLRGWVMRGAIREDDGAGLVALRKWEPFNDDPFGARYRFCHHFYDPVVSREGYGRAFSEFCFGESPRFDAIQWALGSLTPLASPPPEDQTRINHFSILDAREAMWRALTLTDRLGSPVNRLTFSNEANRKAYWATTFRALGDVIHLVQDMAQPQHTRNEGHGTGESKGYEEYIDARVKRERTYQIDGVTLTSSSSVLADFSYSGYAPVRFPRYSDYFSDINNIVAGKGLAQYSNRNFFTPGSNFGNPTYPLPVSIETAYEVVVAPANALPYPGASFVYFNGEVKDQVTGQIDVISMTTQGLFDGLAQAVHPSIRPPFALNRKNYDDRAALLIPRAVGYSAGLLDYFFRGQMEVTLPSEGSYGVVDHMIASGNDPQTGGFRKIKLKVRNTTPDPMGQPNVVEPMDPALGVLVAVAKFHRNTCYAANLSGEYGSSPRPGGKTAEQCRGAEEETVTSAQAAVPQGINGGPSQVEFTFSTPIPISATDLFLQVVYRGPLGNEPDAVVVETKDISEPTYVYNYSRWDQYMYAAYPSVSTGPYTYAQWCTQGGYSDIDACNQANGLTLKFAFSSDVNWISGYDPDIFTIPQETWTNIAQEPTFTQLAKMVGPVGKFNRVAVLLDAVAANKGLVVQEWIDPLNPPSIFKWSTGTPVPTINQWDYSTGGVGTLTRSVSYLAGRGVFVRASDAPLLNDGTAQSIPPFILTPSEIAAGW